MANMVRSLRFNPSFTDPSPRFYSFSTWGDDITRYFSTSSGIYIAPSAFIALNIGDASECLWEIEHYWENKLAAFRRDYLTNSDIDSNTLNNAINNFMPLGDLFQILSGFLESGEILFEPIYEQNYNGSFTDFICTIPHNVKVKQINIDELALAKRYPINNKHLVGWDNYNTVVIYDSILENYNYHSTQSNLKLYEVEESEFTFNCIIPLYQEFDRNSEKPLGLDNPNEISFKKFKPMGIWFNCIKNITEDETEGESTMYGWHIDIKPITIQTADYGEWYTQSWSLSISTQIKPYYAANAVPVTYSSGTDLVNATNTFAGVLAKINELSKCVNSLQPQTQSNTVSNPDNLALEVFKLSQRIKDLEERLPISVSFEDDEQLPEFPADDIPDIINPGLELFG